MSVIVIVSDAIISAYLRSRAKDKTELTTWAEVRSGAACFVKVTALPV